MKDHIEELLEVLIGKKPTTDCKKDGHQFQLHVKGNSPTYVGCKRCSKKWLFR